MGTLRTGTLLAQRYRIDVKLGAGGMGEVYLAEDTRLGRKVALKTLPAEFTRDEDRVRRFEREARAASALNHPNILTIHEIERLESGHFLVTEFVDGSSLRDLLDTGSIDLTKLMNIGSQVAEGLAAAHQAGIVHRDIKPENIMVRRDGYVKLLDFGLAKLIETQPGDATTAISRLTAPGMLVGTLQYVSPEQAEGRSVDHRTDLFSLGSVLYEMVTGEAAFTGTSFIEVLQKIAAAERPRPVTEVNQSAPRELQRIIEKCLAKDPDARYQHGGELAADLRRLKQETEGGAAAERPRFRERRPRPAIRSLAVLPLTNASADPEADYLSDGITEAIISSLSQLPRLRVMAWSAVSGYKGRTVDPRAIGRDLGVATVLAGRLVQRGETVVIGAELVDVEDGWQLWGGQYNRSLSDVYATQAEISLEISQKLRLRLTDRSGKRRVRSRTPSPEAYQAYLKGRYHWNKRQEEGLRKGLESFQRAIELDPAYAQAHAGVADSFILLAEFGILPFGEAFPQARAAALKALEIDDTIAEAHTSLGKILEDQYDWTAAGREYRKAIELNPSYATGHHWYARYLTKVGRLEEAVGAIRRAQALDPLALVVGAVVGEVLFFARRYDEAIHEFRKTLEIDEDFSFGHLGLGLSFLMKGIHQEAVTELEKAVAHSEGSPPNVAHLGLAYAMAGRRDEAMKIVEKFQDQPRRFFQIAQIHAVLGETDQAFELLEKAYAQRSIWMRYIKADPGMDSLRSDPRFSDLVRRVGLSP